jgi:cyclohexanone monooxygenase
MGEHRLDVIEAEAEAEERGLERLGNEAKKTLVPLADSWFTGATVPGKRRQVLLFLGHFGHYRALVDKVAEDGYPGFKLDGEPVGGRTLAA